MGMIVQKFGGTSVATMEKIRRATSWVIEEKRRGNDVVVTVSAMGKTTDELIHLASEFNVRENRREMDLLLSTGEQITVALFTMALQEQGFDAIGLTGWQAGIVTEPVHGRARIVSVQIDRIQKELARDKIVIVAGFQGISTDGEITTLGRGGSDTTAVALAAMLQANRCDIFTDVTGVFTSDPRYIQKARQLSSISYDEMLELAHLGANVLHPRAVEFAKNYQIPLVVRSSMENKQGTIVEEVVSMEKDLIVRGVAFEKDITRIKVFGVPNEIHSLSAIFSILAEHHINVDIIIQSATESNPNSVSFSIKTEDLEATIQLLESKKKDIPFDHLEWESGLAKVSIVGSEMISNPGVAAKMFSCLSAEGIFIKMVSTSEIKISVVLDEKHMIRASDLLHNAFQLEKVSELAY
ncbi:aspartate kinase [Fervidibacillus halotolerans]|uniref:Aspartokinase n=1 Tax=Fervidibacillus halotolerans TaxID=2980027 RepID=A0A9E8LZL9_9BACI|nr:aspartate kinase [Fervidibacillus halotolerans]WAA11619.1 aspartate kinase [Fervidibacillus halotolerans]